MSADSSKTSYESPEDLIQVLYQALNNREYAKAYQLWGDEGAASGQNFHKFKAGYQYTDSVHVEFTGSTEIHGAAGSLYAEVPVRIKTRLRSGKHQSFKGTYILRKTNIGPHRSTANWHIYDSKIGISND